MFIALRTHPVFAGDSVTRLKLLLLLFTMIFWVGCVTSRTSVQGHNLGKAEQREFDYERYHPSKLIDVTKEYDKVIEGDLKNVSRGNAFILIEALSRAVRVNAAFSNEFRIPTEEHITVVKAWLKASNLEKYLDLFQHEVKIREDNIEYWLPIQGQLLPFLQKEINPGEIAEFYIVYFGAYNYDHVFVINEFRKIQ
jgi:hypothetical protein